MGELDRASICARIAQARTAAGLSQPELGEALEPPAHWRTVQTWESVKNPRVPWRRLDEISRITGTTKEWLLHGEATPATTDEDRLREVIREEVAGALADVEALLQRLLGQAPARADEGDDAARAGG
jgi:transcriptional regulator with XRE-family HTH domain